MTVFDTNTFAQRRSDRAPRFNLVRAIAAYRSRRALAQLPAERLNDLGITRQAALNEARRPIWDVPTNWQR